MQAFELCKIGEFDLSYESLTSFEARETLREMKTADPAFWAELTQVGDGADDALVVNSSNTVEEPRLIVEESPFSDIDGVEDDSNVSKEALMAYVLHGQIREGVSVASDSSLQTVDSMADSVDIPNDIVRSDEIDAPEPEFGRGKRLKKANRLYSGDKFWKH